MAQKLRRTFAITCEPDALMQLAARPLLAPAYLNFLESIDARPPLSADDDWATYEVRVSYRSLLKASGLIEHRVDPSKRSAHLRHDGPLAQFEAVYAVAGNHVTLDCLYTAKAPLVSWLVRTVLNRVLAQVAAAMDRYAASFAISPT